MEAADIKKQSLGAISKLQKEVFVLSNEKAGLLQVVKKMKTRKTMDIQSRFCVNCGKEYTDKENFNWSCQKHRSSYGDHMWWCCGKRDVNAPGCKLQKHTTKEDYVDDDVSDKG